MEILNIRKIRIIVLVFLIIMAILVGWGIYKSLQNPYGKELGVANIKKYTSGKPINKDIFNFIKHDLYQTISLNVKHPIGSNSIKDLMIRDESFSQTYDKSVNIYTVHFIIDVKSLKQSYRVEYQWSPGDKYNPNIAEYGTQVTCLPLTSLIYGNFNCKDQNALATGLKNYDQIAPLLPYYVPGKFRINNYNKSESYTVLHVDAFAPATDTTVSQSTLDSYTNDINSWLQSNKLDPNKYMIDYNY